MTNRPAALSSRTAWWTLGVYWVVLGVATHWPGLVIETGLAGLPIDKLLHAGAFGLLAVLLQWAMVGRRKRAVLVAAVYVLIDEYTQQWTHRTVDFGDVVAGWVGVLVVAVILGTTKTSTEDGEEDGGFIGHAIFVSGLTLVSRITGLVRDAVLFGLLGLGPVADAFFIGFLVPNLFRRLFGEGALSAAFIPHYTDLLKKDRQLAGRFAMLCLSGLVVVTVTITLVGEAVLWSWLGGVEPGSKTHMAIGLTMAMLPYMPMVCAVALIGGVLQVHKRFGPPAATPVLLNITMIGFAFWGMWQGHDGDSIVWMLAVSVLAAGVVQLFWQTAVMFKTVPVCFGLGGMGQTLRSMLIMMLPMVVGLAVFQINALLDSLIAFGLSTDDPFAQLHVLGYTLAYPIQNGAVAALAGGQRLYQFPLGVFGIALATAIFPVLAHAAASRHTNDFSQTLRQGLRLSMFIALPASVGLILLREPIVQLFFQRGEFGVLETQRTAVLLAGYAASVWAYSMTHVLTRAFYAQKNARTPLRISLVMVAMNLTMNLILIWPLGAMGLAISSAISGVGQALLLRIFMARQGVAVVDAKVLGSWIRSVVLTAVMGLIIWPIAQWVDPTSTGSAAMIVGLGVVVGGGVIVVGGWFSGAEELRWLMRRRLPPPPEVS